MDIRIGFGYDTHRLIEGRKLIVGGVEIEFDKGLEGHSDSDVLLHALTDAILGALNLRDIGFHFPDNDDSYKNMNSRYFLQGAVKLIQQKGYEVGNCDCTIIAEAPKMNPHIPGMQKIIAEDCGVDVDRISIKATTHEKMGPMGRGEGIASHAVVLIRKTTP